MEDEKKLKKVLEENGVRLLKSDNICIGEQMPLPNGIIGIIHRESEVKDGL